MFIASWAFLFSWAHFSSRLAAIYVVHQLTEVYSAFGGKESESGGFKGPFSAPERQDATENFLPPTSR